MWDGFVRFAGVDVVNDARTKAYGGTKVKCDSCPDLPTILGEQYTNPVVDRALWTIGNNDGANFAGLIVTALTGLGDAQRSVQVTEKLGTGGVVSSARRHSRVIGVTADLIAFTEEGANAGMDWLVTTLTNTSDCQGVDLELLNACPCMPSYQENTNALPVTTIIGSNVPWSASGANPLVGAEQQPHCGLLTVEWTVTSPAAFDFTAALVAGDLVSDTAVGHLAGAGTTVVELSVMVTPGCDLTWVPVLITSTTRNVTVTTKITKRPVITADDVLSRYTRKLSQVVVVDGPKEVKRMTVEGLVVPTVEWTMTAADPYVYQDSETIASLAVTGGASFLPPGVSLLYLGPWANVECAPAESVTTFASPPCSDVTEPPQPPEILDSCAPATDTEWIRSLIFVAPEVSGALSSALSVSLTAGIAPVMARVRVWEYGEHGIECDWTEEFWIDFVPAGSTLTISPGGVVTVSKPGFPTVDGSSNVRGDYRGPYEVSEVGFSRNLVIAVDTAPYAGGYASDAVWDISFTKRVA